MNLRSSRYDPELQMFTDPPREPDLARLRFWRWLAERGLLEHRAEGTPSGAYAAEGPPPDRPAAEAAGGPRARPRPPELAGGGNDGGPCAG